MIPDQLPLYAITIVTLIGMGIFAALVVLAGLILVAITDGLMWLYDRVDQLKNGGAKS